MNPYDVLLIPESSSMPEVKSAFRKLAKKYHPDVCYEDNAEAKFKEVLKAYELINRKHQGLGTNDSDLNIEKIYKEYIEKYPAYQVYFEKDIVIGLARWDNIRKKPI